MVHTISSLSSPDRIVSFVVQHLQQITTKPTHTGRNWWSICASTAWRSWRSNRRCVVCVLSDRIGSDRIGSDLFSCLLFYLIFCHRIVSYRIESCRIVSDVLSYPVSSHLIFVSYRIVSYRIVSCRFLSYVIVPRCVCWMPFNGCASLRIRRQACGVKVFSSVPSTKVVYTPLGLGLGVRG